MKAVILIAGVGKRLRAVTEGPKCLVEIGGVALLERYLKALAEVNIRDVVLVVGYRKEMIVSFVRSLDLPGRVQFIENPDFTRGSVLSLYRAAAELEGDVLLMDGDVYFEDAVLQKLVNADQRNLIAIDTTSRSSGEEMMVGVRGGRVLDMNRNLAGEYDVVGEAIGFYTFDQQACGELQQILGEQVRSGHLDLGYEEVLPLLFSRITFAPIIVDGMKWVEIDFEEDVRRAASLEGR